MKALILAAGYGSRMAPLTDSIPKGLVPVNGKPILFRQIDSLYDCGITDITVISGYRANMLDAAVHDCFRDVNIIESPEYRTTNSMYSAWLARDAMAGSDFIMMNSDVFLDDSVIESLLACHAPNAIVTDIGFFLEGSMRVSEDDAGRLTRISDAIPPETSLGTAIEVYRLSAEAGRAFFDRCDAYIKGERRLDLPGEAALADILAEVEFRACPLKGRWFRIDSPDDLAAAERIFADA